MQRMLIGTLFVLGLLAAASARGGDNDDAKTIAKSLLDALVKADYATASKDFGDEVKKALPPDKLKAVWDEQLKKAGPFMNVITSTIKQKERIRTVITTCRFEKTTLDLYINVEDKKVVGLFIRPNIKLTYKPPAYSKPETFREVEVTINPGEWELPGTLTLPKEGGPFPAVVLVHGSGPQDRDESVGANQPFRDLAGGLATKGIAVLRYEKRTKQHGAKLVKEKVNVTLKEETIDDALAAAALLRLRKEIDPKRIYILGHSLGANVAPLIGQGDETLAGLILLAGNTRPITDLVVEQLDYLLSLSDKPTDAEKKKIDDIKKQMARLNDPKVDEKEVVMGAPASYWLALRKYDAAATAAKLKMPMLILQGERDYQVTMADFAGWKKVLADRKNVQYKSYPKLNHLFVEGEGKSKPAEYDVPGHVSGEVIEDIAAWIKKS